MYGFNAPSLAVIAVSALLIGISKTGVPGLGTLIVPFLALAMPARQSTGFMLVLLVVGDVLAVAVYRRRALWRYLARLLPFAAAGVVVGFLAMRVMSDAVFRPFLGASILAILACDLFRQYRARGKGEKTGTVAGGTEGGAKAGSVNLALAGLTGACAGFFTMIANAAGPIMTVYLLSMGLPKKDFIGTAAWFFFIINLFKIPFSAAQGLIIPETLKWGALLVPAVALGGLIGIFVLRRISEKLFALVVRALTAIAAAKLFF
jgi:uncharacterized protein